MRYQTAPHRVYLVDRWGIEPQPLRCKRSVLPLSLPALWCPLTESNCQSKITNLVLYHLTKGAIKLYLPSFARLQRCEISNNYLDNHNDTVVSKILQVLLHSLLIYLPKIVSVNLTLPHLMLQKILVVYR